MIFDFSIQAFPGRITYISAFLWPATLAGILSLGLVGIAGWMLLRKKRKTHKPARTPARKSPVNYDDLLTTLKTRNGRIQSLLFAGSSLKDLPVNIPVNIAVRLAKQHTCLLIDLDLKRNAVARVFDLEMTDANGVFKPGSYATPLEKLFVWPARNFEQLRQMNLRLLLEGAAKKYDYVLIYAPYLTTLPDRRQVAACAQQAIAFTGRNGTVLMKLLEQCNCKVLEEL